MSNKGENIAIGILTVIIITIIGLIFPLPSIIWVRLGTLVLLLMIVSLFIFKNQLLLYLSKIRFYRLFILCVILPLIVFLTYVGVRSVVDQKIQEFLPFDIGYILAISTFWFIFINEVFSYKTIREQVGLAATCIPFMERDGGKIQTVLIFNPNFNQWMFPGGHISIENDEFPEDVAIKKAEIEAGIVVELLHKHRTIKEYTHCKPKAAPHFEYLLSIDEKAKCRKIFGHEYHLDFTYVAEIKELKEKGNFERVVIGIESSLNEVNKIRDRLHNHITQYHRQNGKAIPKYLFPEDIPDRLFVAFQLYKELKRIERPNHENNL